MTARQLTEPVFDGELRQVNFFNGRLLSAEDMSQEQASNREERRRLGRALGDGIAYGLEVTRGAVTSPAGAPTLAVSAGLAVNRCGQNLMLTNPVEISLRVDSASGNGNATSDIKSFTVCTEGSTETYVAGAALYLLVIGGAEGQMGRAPVSGLGNIQASCNTKYIVPGISFRLISLPFDNADLAAPDRFRNRVAYRCFLGDPLPVISMLAGDAFYTNPFGPPLEKYGLIDAMRASKLSDCEVPLAVVYLAGGNLVFVDMWAARRRITAPAADARFPLVTGDRRFSEAEAMFMQFEAQVEEMLGLPAAQLNAITAASRFNYLPPAGLLPVRRTGTPSVSGFDPPTFFGAEAAGRAVLIDARQVRAVLLESAMHEPIDLAAPGRIQLYRIWENVQAVEAGRNVRPVILFASKTLTNRETARYGYATRGVSRYAASGD